MKMARRLVQSIGPRQQQAKVVAGAGQAGAQRYRTTVAGFGFLQPPAALEHQAQVVEPNRIVTRSQCIAERTLGFWKAAEVGVALAQLDERLLVAGNHPEVACEVRNRVNRAAKLLQER